MTEDRVKVTRGIYVASAVRRDQYPEQKLPEIVFIGRSNVGKSSLINSLVCERNLARVSRQPGKTQTINFYDVGLKISGERKNFYLVDLPGYGYAKIGRDRRAVWQKFIGEYLRTSENIRFASLLIDIRHDPMESDLEMFNNLVGLKIPVLVIATKSDKVGRDTKNKMTDRIKRIIGIPELDVLPYSSKKNEGRSELLDVIADSLIE